MVSKIPLFPRDYEKNACYEHLQKMYDIYGTTSWGAQSLREQFGEQEVSDLIAGDVLDERYEQLRLTFTVRGTIAYYLRNYTKNEIRSINELNWHLPFSTWNRLIEYLVFLENFNLIQLFTLPAWAATLCAAPEDMAMDDVIDRILCLTDRLEPRFVCT